MKQERTTMCEMGGTAQDRRGGGPVALHGERGSALIIAVLVSVILSLLGISYMMMAQTENVIAENERNASMALYVAESGARLAINWFNDPTSTGYLVPTTGQVDRTLRVFDHDNNTATARVLAVASDTTKPIYKDSAVTTSGLFDRPYRAALGDTFLGVETGTDPDPSFATKGPDVVVGASHLTTINNALFPNFPSPNLRARITRIEIYGPPLLTLGGTPTRMGVATVKVTGGVFIFPGTAQERQVATRVVKAVVNEIPIPGPVGPLQSCSALDYNGEFAIHWGAGSSQEDATIPGASAAVFNSKVNSGLPYNLNDPFTYYNDGTNNLATWAADVNVNGQPIDDPWFKYISGGLIHSGQITNTLVQPLPFTWPPAAGSTQTGHSNLFQNTVINCPTFDYALWKSIAQSGGKNHYYYKWSSGANFLLDGAGSPVSFVSATSGKTGVFFFDTYDSLPPRNDWTDTMGPAPSETNLTPAISVSSGMGWQGVQGFIYLNAKQFSTTGAGAIGATRLIIPPGEPGDATGFVNLQYPSSGGTGYTVSNGTAAPGMVDDAATSTRYCVDASACSYNPAAYTPSGTPVWDKTGLPVSMSDVVLDGVMYISGSFSAQGNANYFGSLVAQQGVYDGGGTPDFFFDESLIKGNWPRKGMNLPRVIVTSWQSDL